MLHAHVGCVVHLCWSSTPDLCPLQRAEAQVQRVEWLPKVQGAQVQQVELLPQAALAVDLE